MKTHEGFILEFIQAPGLAMPVNIIEEILKIVVIMVVIRGL